MKSVLLVALILGVLYWIWPESESEPISVEPQASQETVVVQSTATPPPEREPVKAQVQAQAQAQARVPAPKKSRRLGPGIVEFELLKGNWAVSHGDILLGKLESKIKGDRGQFKPKKSQLWESNIIPFAFSKELKDQGPVLKAIEEVNSKTNVQLVPVAEGDKDFLVFSPFEERCASYLGRIGGAQPIFVSEECGTQEILHEIMHALGFVHEQSRKDRDGFVKINWENIEEGFENQFDIAPDNYLQPYKGFVFAFDYNTVMLYSPYHFAKDKTKVTIESTTSRPVQPSQTGLSSVDIQRIDYLYSR